MFKSHSYLGSNILLGGVTASKPETSLPEMINGGFISLANYRSFQEFSPKLQFLLINSCLCFARLQKDLIITSEFGFALAATADSISIFIRDARWVSLCEIHFKLCPPSAYTAAALFDRSEE